MGFESTNACPEDSALEAVSDLAYACSSRGSQVLAVGLVFVEYFFWGSPQTNDVSLCRASAKRFSFDKSLFSEVNAGSI